MEHLERVAVVGVAVDPDHVGLGVDPLHGVADVGRASKKRVTSSIPSMNTNDRTFENWLAIAYTNCRVKRAKLATDPEMSATTMISGFDGWGWRNLGSAGTPP